jgi:DMSO reductase anchor subunit
MHPAPSIIVFTVLSGLGYGLAVMLGLDLLDADSSAARIGHVLALLLIGFGLTSSLLHLGNPQRAWRALSQWRSSWLSREGVLAILTFAPLLAGAWFSLFEGVYRAPVAILSVAGSLATVYCTSMIYASLRSVDGWNTPLTSLCYLLFSLAGGAGLASALASGAALGAAGELAWVAMAFVAIAWLAKIAWRRRLKSIVRRSTPETATGLGKLGRVRLFEPPHMTASYLTHEMGFKVARKHADKLFVLSIIIGGGLPIILFGLVAMSAANGNAATAVSLIAAISYLSGVFVERWLFFAEARHAVMSFYGS